MREGRAMGTLVARTPHKRPKIATLELGRFIAAFYVVLAHLVPDVNSRAAPGALQIWHWIGVTDGAVTLEYFFALSGFVMACSHWQDFGTFGAPLRFWWKRIRRIFPMYWLGLLVPVYFLFGGLEPGYFIRVATLLPVNLNELIPPAWTLRFEMAFYFMFGLGMLPYVGKPILAIWVVATLWHWWPAHELAAMHLQQPAALAKWGGHAGLHFVDFLGIFFFWGMAAGYIFGRFTPGRRLALVLTLAGVTTIAVLHKYISFGGPVQTIPMFVLIGFIIATTMLGFASLEQHDMLRLPRIALWLGIVSYPLYILHGSLLMVFWYFITFSHLSSAGVALLFLGLLIYLFTFASLAAFFIDQPLQRWMRRWGKAKPAMRAAQNAA